MVVLRDAAEAIKVAPADTKIQVGGHTDNTGTSAINTKLSGQRAQVVVDTLVGMGVDASMLSAKGYGDSQPIADNSSEKGRAQNRRMEFTLQ
jgi:outer membrane protein OmpA-like peptidoglycan-associated protein